MKDTLTNMKQWTRFQALAPTDEKFRCVKEGPDSIFVFNKGKKRCGHRYTIEQFLKYYQPIIVSEAEEERKWHKKCKSIEKKLETSGLWPYFKELFHNLQLVSLADKKDIHDRYMYWGDEAERIASKEAIYNDYASKYPFMFDEDKNVHTDYIWEISEAKTKSMYFGRNNTFKKDEIKKALLENRDYACDLDSRLDRKLSYDVSFRKQGEKAWYSEEYRGCGNGHYYAAIDGSCALFIEND